MTTTTGPLPCDLYARDREDACDPLLIVEALADEDARAIFVGLDEPKTAAEITAESDLSTSSVYRKLETLADAGLLTRIDEDSPTATKYAKAVECVSVTYDDPIRIECVRSGLPLYCEAEHLGGNAMRPD